MMKKKEWKTTEMMSSQTQTTMKTILDLKRGLSMSNRLHEVEMMLMPGIDHSMGDHLGLWLLQLRTGHRESLEHGRSIPGASGTDYWTRWIAFFCERFKCGSISVDFSPWDVVTSLCNKPFIQKLISSVILILAPGKVHIEMQTDMRKNRQRDRTDPMY